MLLSFLMGEEKNHFKGEERILCPSPKVATYDLQPEMSAFEIEMPLCLKYKKKQLTSFV